MYLKYYLLPLLVFSLFILGCSSKEAVKENAKAEAKVSAKEITKKIIEEIETNNGKITVPKKIKVKKAVSKKKV